MVLQYLYHQKIKQFLKENMKKINQKDMEFFKIKMVIQLKENG